MAVKPLPYAPIYNTFEKVQSFWNSLKPNHHSNSGSYFEKWLSLSPLFDSISFQNRVCVTLWDVISNRFLYVADKTEVLGKNGYRLTQEDGVDFTFSCMHPDYAQCVLLAHSTGIKYCLDHPEFIPKETVINVDYLYKKLNYGYIHILQQVMVVEVDVEKHPVLFLSYIYDITHLKKEPSANLVIKTPLETVLWNYDFSKRILVSSKTLTGKESNILQLLSEGKPTKEIADKLSVSPHTVDTHRRNLLAKTNCVDTTALVTYSRMVGLI